MTKNYFNYLSNNIFNNSRHNFNLHRNLEKLINNNSNYIIWSDLLSSFFRIVILIQKNFKKIFNYYYIILIYIKIDQLTIDLVTVVLLVSIWKKKLWKIVLVNRALGNYDLIKKGK